MVENLPQPFVSVIIPVFNDSQSLQTCLTSLENQNYPKHLYEVIVVDNNSEEDIKSVVSQFSQVLLTSESYPGSYAARNKGLSIAKGEIIAFTDADCTPASDWIERGVANLLRVPNCGLVAGRIDMSFAKASQPTAVEFCDSVMFLNQKKYVEVERFGATANLFTLKSIFEKVGLFNQALKSGGDSEWGKRVFSSGFTQVYADDTIVTHPARSSFSQLWRKVARTTGGSHQLKKTANYSILTLIKEVGSHLKPPLKFILWRLSDERLSKNQEKAKFFLIMLFLNYIKAWEIVRLELGYKPRR